VAGSGFHVNNLAAFFFGLAMIVGIVGITQWIRRRRICQKLDEFQFRSEAIYRECDTPTLLNQGANIQTQWANEIIAFMKIERINEIGSFKTARSTERLVTKAFTIDAINLLQQIRGRQEFLKSLKDKFKD